MTTSNRCTEFPAPGLRNPFRYVTGHDSNGEPTFLLTDHGDHRAVMLDGEGAESIMYSSNSNPVELTNNVDLGFAKLNRPSVMPSMLVIYPTALYALSDRAHLRSGESILIHAGSGGLGIAAITLARRIGATVYTTVGSDVKREYLINELFVPSSHIFNSRDSTFVQGIMKATDGRGVDVILNSLEGYFMHDSWHCLADFGRFVEVGKRELVDAGNWT
ncbi:polyketide synthase [Fusarium acutatum]|uniref:Polyketide synthase n=1 Tax=Fusarium acutatum TaxID=78861 RepID=A0A8H4NFK3_9HYPO|nr:polyketide synthase [Fusarium acutatum]